MYKYNIRSKLEIEQIELNSMEIQLHLPIYESLGLMKKFLAITKFRTNNHKKSCKSCNGCIGVTSI
jgi:hypothetical protein